jgi:hypothetical protein
MATNVRYADKLQEGSVSLERKGDNFILSNLETGITTRFTKNDYRKALDNFKMWTKMSNKRFADW